MLVRSRSVFLKLGSGFLLSVLASVSFAQRSQLPSNEMAVLSETARELPEAPTPHLEASAADSQASQTPTTTTPDKSTTDAASPSAQSSASTGSSNSQSNPAAPADDQKTKQQKADEQIKQQEHQRVLGIIPSFNTSYVSDAVSLTPKQKVSLAFRSAVDPYTFAIAFIVAGMGEADGGGPGFGWGPKGYFERSGAAYLDAFDGTMVGNAFLPIILHQDPRYFRLGHGSFHHRLFYAVATSFICKHDNTGKWEPNYSNVAGNIISGEISNLYYPDTKKSNIAQTFESGITVTLEGTFGATLQEFWPDISRKLFHKDPTNGLDAQARAADQAAKKAKQSQPSTQSQQ
jgi:hypothetical protein